MLTRWFIVIVTVIVIRMWSKYCTASFDKWKRIHGCLPNLSVVIHPPTSSDKQRCVVDGQWIIIGGWTFHLWVHQAAECLSNKDRWLIITIYWRWLISSWVNQPPYTVNLPTRLLLLLNQQNSFLASACARSLGWDLLNFLSAAMFACQALLILISWSVFGGQVYAWGGTASISQTNLNKIR